MSTIDAEACAPAADEAQLLAAADDLEAAGDLAGAYEACTQVLGITTDPSALAARMGRLALELGDVRTAETLLTVHAQGPSPDAAAIANLAQAQAAQQHFEEAYGSLKSAIQADPSHPRLWRALGELLMQEARHGEAIVFLEEALRLEPDSGVTLDRLADAILCSGGDLEQALKLGEDAVAKSGSAEMPALVAGQARRLLSCGRQADGWLAFVNWIAPGPAAGIRTKLAVPPWNGAVVTGGFLVMGEEDLADELLLAHTVAEMTYGKLILAIDPRWRSLAERAFPKVSVVPLLRRTHGGERQQTAELNSPHIHARSLVSAWTSLRDLVAGRRLRATDITVPRAYLRADPKRVRRWRAWLDRLGPGPRIGVQWRLDSTRAWQTPSAQALIDTLAEAKAQIVSLQPADVPGEAAWLSEAMGVEIHEPPEFDHSDLEDLAALTTALDATLGPPDIATHLAGACGARAWLLCPPGAWQTLGTQTYPWFPRAELFQAAPGPDWSDAVSRLETALAALAAGREQV